jgi:hypothetical protein
MPSNNKSQKWTMNSEEYGSDRVVLTDGLRNTTIHDSRQPDSCSRSEPESCQASGSGHCSTAAFVMTCNARHETQCEEAARHRHQLHVATDFLQIMYDWCGNYKCHCQQWRGMYTDVKLFPINDWWYTNPTELDAVPMLLASHTISTTWTQDTLWKARSIQGSVHLHNT